MHLCAFQHFMTMSVSERALSFKMRLQHNIRNKLIKEVQLFWTTREILRPEKWNLVGKCK
jgi:hypothetical protein